MQNIERLFGIRISLSEMLEEYRLEALKDRAALIMARKDFDPQEYHLYFHALTVELKKSHFSAVIEIEKRLEELILTFTRNPKQDRDQSVKFFNHLLEPATQKPPCSPKESSVVYHLSGGYLANNLLFKNELITFISKDLRQDHRKIKISVQAVPTTGFRKRLNTEERTVTKLDLRYWRYTPFKIEKEKVTMIRSRKSAPYSNLENTDHNRLRDILARPAGNSDDPRAWFRDLLSDSDLPEVFTLRVTGTFRGNAVSDATGLIRYAFARGVQEGKPQYTALGAILRTALNSDISLDDKEFVAALILKYRMYRDESLAQRLRVRFGIPNDFEWKGAVDRPATVGPWLGNDVLEEDVELQTFLYPKPDYTDVGFLERAIQSGRSVCRIEIPPNNALGTGFLVADDMVLTNYHVMQARNSEDLNGNVRNAAFRFRNVTAADGKESDGLAFRANDSRPVLCSSPPHQLDFILVQLQPEIKDRSELTKANLVTEIPSRGMPLNILGHPRRGALSLALSKDGVRDVYQDRGLVQYVTPAFGGSSGSPCFNDDWQVVALHHAEKARSFGSVREGILMKTIHAEIQKFL